MNIYTTALAAGIKPDPNITLTEWANEYFQLPRESTSEYGKYRTSRTPQVEEILDELSPQSPTQKVVVVKPTQCAGTTIALIFMCATADLYPGPLLFWQPTDTMVKSFSTKKLSKTIELIPSLRAKIKDRKVKNSSNTILSKTFPGGSFLLSGANSEASYRSESVRYAIIDDFNGFPSNIEGQGAPSKLVDRRTGTFSNRKVYINSTTTIPSSNIEIEFESSSQGYFHTPCPWCGFYQYLEWGERAQPGGIKFTRDDKGIVTDAWYQCACCKNRINESEKPWMFENGAYVHTYPEREIKGFKYNALHTPLGWVNSWKYIATEFVESVREMRKGNPEGYIAWLNTMMSEPYEQKGERKGDEIKALCDDRPAGLVPSEGVLGITAGIDTQDNGFYYVIRAWGAGLESWLIRYGFIDSWDALHQIIFDSAYEDANGKSYRVLFALQDAMGHRTKEVYDFCRVRSGIMPIKGEQKLSSLHSVSNIDAYPGTNKPIPGGIKLLRINTTAYKNHLSTKLQVSPADAGAFHLHGEITDEYVHHMTAEYINDKGIWECPGSRANHLWDCEVMALVAADYIGVQYFKQQGRTTPRQQQQKKTERRFNRPSWLNR